MSVRAVLLILIAPLMLNGGSVQPSGAAPLHCDSHACTLEAPSAPGSESASHGHTAGNTPCDSAEHCATGCCGGTDLAATPVASTPLRPPPPDQEPTTVGNGAPAALLRPPDA